MTDEELDAIEARARRAQPDPWRALGDSGLQMVVGAMRHGNTPLVADSVERPDAAFIAAARTDVPALIAEIRRLRSAR